jgi:8-oxo-dGTP pyrophosphatase MutT (NUDIX family)
LITTCVIFQFHMPQSSHDLRPNADPRRGAVAVIVRNDRLLVIQRSLHVSKPLSWCFPGGAIETGETEPQAIVRELHEELNAAVRPLRHLWRSTTAWNVQLSWWLAELEAGAALTPNPHEVADFRWVPCEEFRTQPGVLSSNLEFLDALSRGDFTLAAEM